MVYPSMTGPAVPAFGLNPGYHAFMASHTIGLDETFSPLGNFYGFGIGGRVEINNIPGAINPFPDQMVEDIVVGQVAIDALDGSIDSGHEPGFVFFIHDMATVAKLGSGGQSEHFRGGDRSQDSKSCQNHCG